MSGISQPLRTLGYTGGNWSLLLSYSPLFHGFQLFSTPQEHPESQCNPLGNEHSSPKRAEKDEKGSRKSIPNSETGITTRDGNRAISPIKPATESTGAQGINQQ